MCRACGKISCSYLRLAPHYDDPKAADRHKKPQTDRLTNGPTDRQISLATSPAETIPSNNLENNYGSSNRSGHSGKTHLAVLHCGDH